MSNENAATKQYMRDIGRTPLLTHEDEIRLTTAAQAGCRKSREDMALANLRLVVSVAKAFHNRGLALMDLVAEGNTGLLHAIEKFDPTAGFRFSTYAVTWIRERMQRAIINQAHTIRVPIHAHGDLVTIARGIDALVTKNGALPTDSQLAEQTGLPMPKVRTLMRVMASNVCYLADLGGPDEDYMERLADTECLETEVMGDREMVRGELTEALAHLTPREQQVIAMRYGLHNEEMTLEAVAEVVGLTRERVRQIQNDALAKLRRRLQPPPWPRTAQAAGHG